MPDIDLSDGIGDELASLGRFAKQGVSLVGTKQKIAIVAILVALYTYTVYDFARENTANKYDAAKVAQLEAQISAFDTISKGKDDLFHNLLEIKTGTEARYDTLLSDYTRLAERDPVILKHEKETIRDAVQKDVPANFTCPALPDSLFYNSGVRILADAAELPRFDETGTRLSVTTGGSGPAAAGN